jgi:hypothetical protein
MSHRTRNGARQRESRIRFSGVQEVRIASIAEKSCAGNTPQDAEAMRFGRLAFSTQSNDLTPSASLARASILVIDRGAHAAAIGSRLDVHPQL